MSVKFSWEEINKSTGWLTHIRNCKYETININDYEIEQVDRVRDFIRNMKEELDKYKKLWNEETQLVEMMQKDKDYMDLKLMKAIELINDSTLCHAYKENIINLINKARGRV
jgi:phenylacetate-coenzyme A ligase PaaK-like adenylate-forming protein